MTTQAPLHDNIIVDKTFTFAVSILKFCQILQEERHFVISNQLLKSGTSIGANTREVQNAESKPDFIHKFKIAIKEVMYHFQKDSGQRMTSRIRLLTIFFSLTMLAAFGAIPYLLFFKKGLTEINVATLAGTVMLLLLIGGITAIFWLTLIVKIDIYQKQIIFFYPFRRARTNLKFDEILGFRFKYLTGKIEYKALQIRTKSGQTFTFSDFETANLRDFENHFIEHFELRRGKSFTRLSKKDREYEIQNSRGFDFEQAKEIRFMLFMAIAFCIFIAGTIIKKNIDNSNELSIATTVGVLTILIVLTSSIVKLKRTIKTIKNGA